MSKGEIIAALPHLTPEDRAEVQAKLDELAGDAWQDRSELSEADKQALDASLADYRKSPLNAVTETRDPHAATDLR